LARGCSSRRRNAHAIGARGVPGVLITVCGAADARAAGLNRSEMIEQALRNEHLRVALQNYTTRTVPALDIDAYAQKVYQANRSAGL
jgi:ribbon-helix-helix CopG family protein